MAEDAFRPDISPEHGRNERIEGPCQGAPMDVYFDTKETELLLSILERHLAELHREIHHTDRAAFKAGLEADETLVQTIMGKLKTPAAMGI